jgi:hypothetical protein
MVNFYARSFRRAVFDNDHYLIVAKVRERLSVYKRKTGMFDMKLFNLKNLNEVQGKEQY